MNSSSGRKDTLQAVKHILQVSEEINRLKDVDAILDRILYESRSFAGADAGTIYTVDEGRLKFGCVQNDTLFKKDTVDKAVYADFSIPINDNSIVGYAAHHGEVVKIDDAYDIPADRPYSFNPSFDKKSGYETRSMLTIPVKSMEDKLVGVIQIINAKDDRGGPVPFSKEDETMLPLFASQASTAIESGIMTRELVLRMMRMAELRDPSETGAHVQRVGAFSAEIYHRWAVEKGVPEKELKRYKDRLRIAAMLHDVGKVGISDAILKKPGRLDDEERNIMMFHTVYGGQLFLNSTSELDAMCKDIALGHHEKWAGGGYPGKVARLPCRDPRLGEPYKGEDIPLSARIVALADVYDALSSKRSYKEAWDKEKVLGIIKKDTGTHFDPEVTEAFMDVLDVIEAIMDKYKEEDPDRDPECSLEAKLLE
jgi:HD-GYP domain-containing protein (c-di-GMP phosphodiesterase class II)